MSTSPATDRLNDQPTDQSEESSASAPAAVSSGTMSRKQIRGSTLLLAARVFSKFLNFASQVLIVRALTKDDYGAFAYALAMAGMAQVTVLLGLDRAVSRFVPIYHEQSDGRKLRGVLALVMSTVLVLSSIGFLALYLSNEFIGRTLIGDPLATSLLLIMVCLAPIQALDEIMVSLFAVFAASWQIALRRHVVGPVLKLIAVLVMIALGGSAHVLAIGYVAASALGLLVYAPFAVRMLKDEEVLRARGRNGIDWPWRELFGFTLPLLTTDLFYLGVNAVGVMLLEYYWNNEAVAALRAVVPTAMLNQFVLMSFSPLFTPTLARLYARGDTEAISRNYWHTTTWVAVLSFPIFALTFSLSGPITILLYGEAYRQSSMILALLALGYYFNVALGFNGMTLRVYGKVGYVMLVNLLAFVLSIALNFLLIPRYGAQGAAVAACVTLVSHNLLKQLGLRLGTGISFFNSSCLPVYLSIAVAATALLLLQTAEVMPVWLELPLAGLVSLLVFWTNRKSLDIGGTFPELRKWPFLHKHLT